MAATDMSAISAIVGSHRQAILPNNLSATFTADDTDNHDYRAAGKGKGRLSVAVNNPANQSLTVTIYGAHSATGEVGDAGTFSIGSFTVANATQGYETVNDPFPWYIIRVAYGVTPTDDPKKTCSVYADLQSS